MCLLRYICLLAHGGVQYILCFVFLRFVYLMLPFSLDCPFLIASSVFSNVYVIQFTLTGILLLKIKLSPMLSTIFSTCLTSNIRGFLHYIN